MSFLVFWSIGAFVVIGGAFVLTLMADLHDEHRRDLRRQVLEQARRMDEIHRNRQR